MKAVDTLLEDCRSRDVRIEVSGDGNLTVDAPSDALTPDLLDRLRRHKLELLERLSDEPRVEQAAMPSYDYVECINPSDLKPCPRCGTLDQWLSAAGDRFGRSPGVWRCSKCDPPVGSRRMAEAAARIRAGLAFRPRGTA